MKNKAIIVSISKCSYKCVYGFEKNQDIAKAFFDIFIELGFEKEDYGIIYFLRNEEGGDFANVNSVEDRVHSIKNEMYDVDVFFGNRLVFLSVRFEEDRQVEVSEIVNKFARFRNE